MHLTRRGEIARHLARHLTENAQRRGSEVFLQLHLRAAECADTSPLGPPHVAGRQNGEEKMVAANRNTTGQNAQGTNANPSTTPEEIDAAARQAGVLTVRMIGEALGVSEATVRSRMEKHKNEIKPVAKIHPKGRGRYTPGYDRSVLDLLGAEVQEVRVERIDDNQGGGGNRT